MTMRPFVVSSWTRNPAGAADSAAATNIHKAIGAGQSTGRIRRSSSIIFLGRGCCWAIISVAGPRASRVRHGSGDTPMIESVLDGTRPVCPARLVAVRSRALLYDVHPVGRGAMAGKVLLLE